MRVLILRLAPAIGAVILIALIAAAWPRPTDVGVRQAYALLKNAAVPVKVLGWVTPQAAQAELLADGYRLTLRDPVLGDITIVGSRGGLPAEMHAAPIRWREDEVDYAVTAAEPQLIAPRIVSLEAGEHQLGVATTDTPLLYLFYLPLLVSLSAWGAWSLLSESVDELRA
jgi:hypothetical protein